MTFKNLSRRSKSWLLVPLLIFAGFVLLILFGTDTMDASARRIGSDYNLVIMSETKMRCLQIETEEINKRVDEVGDTLLEMPHAFSLKVCEPGAKNCVTLPTLCSKDLTFCAANFSDFLPPDYTTIERIRQRSVREK